MRFINITAGTGNWQSGLQFYCEETFYNCILNLKGIFRKDFANAHTETITKLKGLGKNQVLYSALSLLHCADYSHVIFQY